MSLLSRLGRNVFHDRLCPVLYSFNSSLSWVIHEAPISTINNHGPWSLPSSIHLVQDPRQASLMVEFLNSKDLMLVLSILHSLIHRKGTRGLGLSFNSLTGDLVGKKWRSCNTTSHHCRKSTLQLPSWFRRRPITRTRLFTHACMS